MLRGQKITHPLHPRWIPLHFRMFHVHAGESVIRLRVIYSGVQNYTEIYLYFENVQAGYWLVIISVVNEDLKGKTSSTVIVLFWIHKTDFKQEFI